jgi:hypothetical protein
MHRIQLSDVLYLKGVHKGRYSLCLRTNLLIEHISNGVNGSNTANDAEGKERNCHESGREAELVVYGWEVFPHSAIDVGNLGFFGISLKVNTKQ